MWRVAPHNQALQRTVCQVGQTLPDLTVVSLS